MNDETTNNSGIAAPVVQGVVMALCPFCGKTEPLRVCDSYEDVSEIDYCNDKEFAVVCDASKYAGVGPGGCGAMSGYAATEGEAIDKWNTRTMSVLSTGEVRTIYKDDRWCFFVEVPKELFGKHVRVVSS